MPAYVKQSLRGRVPSKCINCENVHRHRDDAVFCSRYSFRVSDDTAIPSYCKKFHRRIGMISKASLSTNEAVPKEWGNPYKEQGGTV